MVKCGSKTFSVGLAMSLRHKAQSTNHKRKYKLVSIKIKNIYVSKDTIKKTEKITSESEKIFAKDLFDKGTVTLIHKDLLHLKQ